MAWAGTTTQIDNFDRAQALTTTPGFNGWKVADTSSGGTPTYLVTTSGAGMKLTLDSTNDAEIVTMYHNDVLVYDILKIDQIWWVAKVGSIDSVTQLALG